MAFVATDRTWQVLPDPSIAGQAKTLFQAGLRLGDVTIHLGGVTVDGPRLTRIAKISEQEPFVRVLREHLRHAIDAPDFLFFLDDVLFAKASGNLRSMPDGSVEVWLSSGRARSAGILLHADDVFGEEPRIYGDPSRTLCVEKPQPLSGIRRARNWEQPGANWVLRFPNPSGEKKKIAAIKRKRPRAGFHHRIQSLMQQLRNQGATVVLTSTVRSPKRGYLMWGAYSLAQTQTKKEFKKQLRRVISKNRQWGLKVPIRWKMHTSWRDNVAAAREMADAYDVVYATEAGAKSSNHYEATAVDLMAYGLPRVLVLEAPDHHSEIFDLSAPEQSRDMNLTPELIEWVAEHFQLEKHLKDYPHWNDAVDKRRTPALAALP